MKSPHCNVALAVAASILITAPGPAFADPPSSFDLRDVEGVNYVSSVKSQVGGTCWTFGAMAAMESNLIMTGNWAAAWEYGEPNLAEYHLDWWNGFNRHNNDDKNPPTGGGLTVHQGGDYMVTSAYLTRGEGAVRDIDGQSYSSPPARSDPSYHYYYPRDVEWYVAGSGLGNINTIKYKIMAEGALGTCMCYSENFMHDYVHYQPPGTTNDPNHAIAIVGWDDSIENWAPLPGAWLCKNSWGSGYGDGGYFWISYYDKHCGQHPQMGAVSFQNVEPMQYDHVYYHDYHGWRDTKTNSSEAFNAFSAEGAAWGEEELHAVSFFTAANNVTYAVRIYDRFQGGELLDELATKTGTIQYRGFHTVELDTPLELIKNDDFYVYLELSAGGQAYDRSSDIPVLLGSSYRTWVPSSSSPGQSYYRSGGNWLDLYDYNDSANFCMKALSVDVPPLIILLPDGSPEYVGRAVPTAVTVEIDSGCEEYVPGSGTLHYRYEGGEFFTSSLTSLGGNLYEATLPPANCDLTWEYYVSAEGDRGSTAVDPPDAPDSLYISLVTNATMVLDDDFDTDHGWTVGDPSDPDGATTGIWSRMNPEPTCAQPEDDHTLGPSTLCWVTDGEAGPLPPGSNDVDGGKTTLMSPTLDLSAGGDTRISYWRWYSNDEGHDPDNDIFTVDISNNGGGAGSWVNVETIGPTGEEASGEWFYHQFWASDFVTLTDQVKIRFVASDYGEGSVVEAAIDDFQAVIFECQATPDCPGDFDGDGYRNVTDFGLFAAAYASHLGDLNYNPDADFNDDGFVNITDFDNFASGYRVPCP